MNHQHPQPNVIQLILNTQCLIALDQIGEWYPELQFETSESKVHTFWQTQS